jgi:hypothetical protein
LLLIELIEQRCTRQKFFARFIDERMDFTDESLISHQNVKNDLTFPFGAGHLVYDSIGMEQVNRIVSP